MDMTVVLIVIVVVVIVLYLFYRAREGLATAPARVYIDSDSTKLIVFFMPWCGHCQKFLDGPNSVWNQLKRKYRGRTDVTLAEVNCEKYPEIARQYGVNSYPTIIKFQGKRIVKFSGERTLSALEQFLLNA